MCAIDFQSNLADALAVLALLSFQGIATMRPLTLLCLELLH